MLLLREFDGAHRGRSWCSRALLGSTRDRTFDAHLPATEEDIDDGTPAMSPHRVKHPWMPCGPRRIRIGPNALRSRKVMPSRRDRRACITALPD